MKWVKFAASLMLMAIPYGGGVIAWPVMNTRKNKVGVALANFFAYALLLSSKNLKTEVNRGFLSMNNFSYYLLGTIVFIGMLLFVIEDFDGYKYSGLLITMTPVLTYIAMLNYVFFVVSYAVFAGTAVLFYWANENRNLPKKGKGGLFGEIIIPSEYREK